MNSPRNQALCVESLSVSQPKKFKMARELAGSAERVEGVWMRQIELLNPAE
jgi:hypothetical protein